MITGVTWVIDFLVLFGLTFCIFCHGQRQCTHSITWNNREKLRKIGSCENYIRYSVCKTWPLLMSEKPLLLSPKSLLLLLVKKGHGGGSEDSGDEDMGVGQELQYKGFEDNWDDQYQYMKMYYQLVVLVEYIVLQHENYIPLSYQRRLDLCMHFTLGMITAHTRDCVSILFEI